MIDEIYKEQYNRSIVTIINVCTMISKIFNVQNISFDIYISLDRYCFERFSYNKFLIATVNR